LSPPVSPMTDSGQFPTEAPEEVLPVGTRLGKYEIVRLLGAGGMGAVYEAAHTEIGKRVAVKVLSTAIASVPGARARFLREAQLTSKVQHPNIVDVTDMGNDGGQAYLVMEFLQGMDLSQRLAQVGRINASELVDIMLPVCSAVTAAHDAGITHRDLKPQNIFLAEEHHALLPKVLDFGISKGTDQVSAGALTGTGAMIGTPYYLAPEQILDGKTAGPASDQYALGVILYECLTGRRPYDGDNLFFVFQSIVNGTAPAPRTVAPEIVPGLEGVIMRAMSADPKARYRSVKHLGRSLLPFASVRARMLWEEPFRAVVAEPADTAADDSGPSAPPPHVDEALSTQAGVETVDLTPPSRFSGRWSKLFALGIGLAAAGVVAIWVSGSKAPPSAPPAPKPVATSGQTAAKTSETTPDKTQDKTPDKTPQKTAAPTPVAPSRPAVAPAQPPPPVPEFAVAVTAEPPTATWELDGTPIEAGGWEATFPLDHRRHVLRAMAPGFEPREEAFTDAPPSEHWVLRAKASGSRRIPPRPRPPAAEPAAPPPVSVNPNGAPVID